MTRGGRPKAELVLSDVERQTLLRWSRRATTAQALALRSRIVLACAEDVNNKDVAARLGIWPQTVSKWRARFVKDRLEGLADEPRPGAARTITDEQVEQVIVTTLEESPAGGDTHWSTRSMARATGMSQTAISRIWRAFGLKPHLVDTWKLSKDPQFIEKVRDVVGLYLDPPDKAMVLAVDEKSQMQALDRTAPMRFLAQPGRAMVRRVDQPQATPLGPPQRRRTQSRRGGLDRGVEQGPETVRVDQDRRRDPGQPRPLLHTT
jgi:transposase